MTAESRSSKIKPLIAGFAVGLIFCTGIAIGLGVKWLNGNDAVAEVQTQDVKHEMPSELKELLLRADSASGAKTMAMATGPIDDSVEGLFVLDFLTGELFCWVVSPNTGWMAQYRTNVAAEFGGVDKERAPEYVMTTGRIGSVGRTGQGRPANTICYVGDANSGKVIAFGLTWDRTIAARGGDQQGVLFKWAEGATRSANIERD